MTHARSRWARLSRLATAALAGGSLCQTCDTRLRDALVDGTRNYISTLLDPQVILAGLLDEPGAGANLDN